MTENSQLGLTRTCAKPCSCSPLSPYHVTLFSVAGPLSKIGGRVPQQWLRLTEAGFSAENTSRSLEHLSYMCHRQEGKREM